MLARKAKSRLSRFCTITVTRSLTSLPSTKSSHNDGNYKNNLFDQKIKQQMLERVPRIEKIEVNYEGRGISDNALMFMNKHMSTPYHCAMHVSHGLAQSAVLALVKPHQVNSSLETPDSQNTDNPMSKDHEVDDDPLVWSMHRPLEYNCSLQILRFNMPQSSPWHHEQVNKAYWRSCAFLLGAITQEAFQNSLSPQVFKYPDISVRRGAFCCDITLDRSIEKWNADEESLIYLTKLVRNVISKNLKFEPLTVEPEFARELFCKDKYHIARIDDYLAKGNFSTITLYRLGNYIDMVDGPLITNTSHIFHFVVTAIKKLQNKSENVWRIQGLSLPKELKVHHTVWSLLEKRARNLVMEDINQQDQPDTNKTTNLLTYQSIENKTKIYSKATGQWVSNKWSTPKT